MSKLTLESTDQGLKPKLACTHACDQNCQQLSAVVIGAPQMLILHLGGLQPIQLILHPLQPER